MLFSLVKIKCLKNKALYSNLYMLEGLLWGQAYLVKEKQVEHIVAE